MIVDIWIGLLFWISCWKEVRFIDFWYKIIKWEVLRIEEKFVFFCVDFNCFFECNIKIVCEILFMFCVVIDIIGEGVIIFFFLFVVFMIIELDKVLKLD